MNEESKEVDRAVDEAVLKEVVEESTNAPTPDNDDADEDEGAESASTDAVAAHAASKKKKSKKAKLKKALGVTKNDDADAGSSSPKPASKLTQAHVEQLLEMNPSLKGEVAGMDKEKAAETLKKLDVSDLLTGMVGPHQVLPCNGH